MTAEVLPESMKGEHHADFRSCLCTFDLSLRRLGRCSYLRQHSVRSSLYRTPDEDVGFWYRNLSSSLNELKSIPADAAPLEKSNMLMKLRETLVDQGETSVVVTVPPGISIFPYNTLFALWCAISAILAVVSGFASFASNDD
ncbi:MAG: hypothetical protein AAB605_03450 [Patescibacteria group bacterium]